MNRRQLIGGAAAAALVGPSPAPSARGAREAPLALDAMGEIRLTHGRDLLREVIAGGTRSVTVTLANPQLYGEAALDDALADIAAYDRHIRANEDLLLKATRVRDIDRARAEAKLALFYMFQNTTPVQKDLDRIDLLYGLGLRALQLTYNHQNYVGSGCRERGDYGLSAFGHEVIERMNEVGMLVDTSHANMRTMAEAIVASDRPTIISHTACAALHAHVRNTTDANLRLLAEHGGVVGICQIRPFLTDDRGADNVRHYIDHIDHAIRVAGTDHVCIGSDRDHRVIEDTPEEYAQLVAEVGPQFREQDWPLFMPALTGPRRMEVVRDLLSRRHPAAVVDKVLSGNLYRLYAEVIG